MNFIIFIFLLIILNRIIKEIVVYYWNDAKQRERSRLVVLIKKIALAVSDAEPPYWKRIFAPYVYREARSADGRAERGPPCEARSAERRTERSGVRPPLDREATRAKLTSLLYKKISAYHLINKKINYITCPSVRLSRSFYYFCA